MIKKILLIALCVGVSVVLADNSGIALPMPQHDPFARPVLKKTLQSKASTSNTESEMLKPWTPVLTSTLRAGANSMVIVGGRVVKIGEQVDGYRLLEVGERDALFEKEGGKIRLTIEE